MDAKAISKLTQSAIEDAKWVGLAETDLHGRIMDIIINRATAGLKHCTIGCLSDKGVIADFEKLGFTVDQICSDVIFRWP